MIYLREPKTIEVTKALLDCIHYRCSRRHRNDATVVENNPGQVSVRVFLAMYMISQFSADVFEATQDTLVQNLVQSSMELKTNFHSIIAALVSNPDFRSVDPMLTKEFPRLLFDYIKNFQVWKVPDEAKLATRFTNALIALYSAQQVLLPGDTENQQLAVEFRTQIEKLRSKLCEISGESALARFDTEHRSLL